MLIIDSVFYAVKFLNSVLKNLQSTIAREIGNTIEQLAGIFV